MLEISLVELLEEEVLLAKDEEERRVLELLRALPDPQKALAIRLIEQLQPTAPTTE